MRKPIGWRGESYRHSLAARGVKTSNRVPMANFTKARNIGREFAHRFSSMDALQQYGIDEASNMIKNLPGVEFGTERYYLLMEEFYIGFGSEGDKITLPRTSSEIKREILMIVDRGGNDFRDIDAGLYETDYHDELDELVRDGILRESGSLYFRR